MRNVSQQLIQDRIRDLRENTDFVSTLLESLIGYAIIAADFDGNIIAFNEGARQVYGYAPEEVIGKQTIEIFFPREFIEAGKLQEITDDLIEKGRFSYEGEKVRKDGEKFPAQILFTLTKDKSGKVVGFIEIVEDLTERKRAELALKRRTDELASSRAFLAAILDSTVDAILTVNEHGVIRSINKATVGLFGYEESKLIGKGIDILLPDTALGNRGKSLIHSDLRGGGGGGGDKNHESQGLTESGQIFDCEITIRQVVGFSEELDLFTIIIRDITERKRAENELKRFNVKLESIVAERTQQLATSRAFLAGILDSAIDAILTVDERGVIKSVNKGATELFGYEEDELLGINLIDILHESYLSEFKKNISHHLGKEE